MLSEITPFIKRKRITLFDVVFKVRGVGVQNIMLSGERSAAYIISHEQTGTVEGFENLAVYCLDGPGGKRFFTVDAEQIKPLQRTSKKHSVVTKLQ